MSSLISKELDKKLKEMTKKKEEKAKSDKDAKAYIMSLFESEHSEDVKPSPENKTSVSASSVTSPSLV